LKYIVKVDNVDDAMLNNLFIFKQETS